MQAYHWPSAEHLFMGQFADRWVALDLVQLTRKSWMTRNRLRNADAIFWFGPRIAHTGKRLALEEASVLEGGEYVRQLLASIQWYRRNTPYGTEIYNLVAEVLQAWDRTSLSQLNVLTTRAFFEWLGSGPVVSAASEIAGFPRTSAKGRWALDAALAIGSRSVVNPSAGTSFFELDAYHREGVSLRAYTCEPLPIPAQRGCAVGAGLSWIDTASFLGRETLVTRLHRTAELQWLVRTDAVQS